jgi:hypothetical protein
LAGGIGSLGLSESVKADVNGSVLVSTSLTKNPNIPLMDGTVSWLGSNHPAWNWSWGTAAYLPPAYNVVTGVATFTDSNAAALALWNAQVAEAQQQEFYREVNYPTGVPNPPLASYSLVPSAVSGPTSSVVGYQAHAYSIVGAVDTVAFPLMPVLQSMNTYMNANPLWYVAYGGSAALGMAFLATEGAGALAGFAAMAGITIFNGAALYLTYHGVRYVWDNYVIPAYDTMMDSQGNASILLPFSGTQPGGFGGGHNGVLQHPTY